MGEIFFPGFIDPEECIRIIMKNYWLGKKIQYTKSCRRKKAVTFWLKEWREKEYNHTASDMVPVSLLNLERKLLLYFSILQRDSRTSKWDKILQKDPSKFHNMKKSTMRKLEKEKAKEIKSKENFTIIASHFSYSKFQSILLCLQEKKQELKKQLVKINKKFRKLSNLNLSKSKRFLAQVYRF